MSDDAALLYLNPRQTLVTKLTPSLEFIYRGPGSRQVVWDKRYGTGYLTSNTVFWVHN